MNFSFDNSFANELPDFYAASNPAPCSSPELVYFNHALAEQLQLNTNNSSFNTAELTQLLSGNQLPAGAQAIAQTYAGHQFGQFNPQLGDGRAVIIGEVIDSNSDRFDIAFKGSGQTPYSRGGDGKAGLASMLREVLMAEAMHALGIPTTRSLAVVATGDPVYRDAVLPGAVLTRVASSHIRIGTFQFFGARKQHEQVKQLADYSIARHDPELIADDQTYIHFLRAVIQRQASLIAQWMGVGFIHGVMNTDNMTIAGETIDYGPCAFMEAYNPATVFSSIDHQGRYAYQNQPSIALWNLARFAETLLPLLDENTDKAVEIATEELNTFSERYDAAWLEVMRNKLGLQSTKETGENNSELMSQDRELAKEWLTLLEQQQIDFTQAFRALSMTADLHSESKNTHSVLTLFDKPQAVQTWLKKWHIRCAEEGKQNNRDSSQRHSQMNAHNPWLIPRNHRVEEALQLAEQNADFSLFDNLLQALQKPFEEQSQHVALATPASSEFTRSHQTFCGT